MAVMWLMWHKLMLLIATVLQIAVPIELGHAVSAVHVAQMVEALLKVDVFVFQFFKPIVDRYQNQSIEAQFVDESIYLTQLRN